MPAILLVAGMARSYKFHLLNDGGSETQIHRPAP